MSLVDASVCAAFHVAYYSGRRQDREASKLVADTNGVPQDTGRYWKATLKCDELDDVKCCAHTARSEFYKATLDWRDGMRIMPTASYMKYAPIYKDYKRTYESLVDRFVVAYPSLIAQAQKKLGPMFNWDDYPSPVQVREKFSMSLDIFPVPTANDFRITLNEQALQEMQESTEARMRDAQSTAMADLWSRLSDRVTKMSETFADPDKRFWDSLVADTIAMCDELTCLNFNGDPKFEAARKEVADTLGTLSVENLRGNRTYRAEAAKEARDMLARIASYK